MESPEADLGSKMERFVIRVNGWKWSQFSTMVSILTLES